MLCRNSSVEVPDFMPAFSAKSASVITSVVNAILLLWFAIMWVTGEGIGFSYGFFALVTSLCFICVLGVTVGNDERDVLRDISFGSFGAVIITVIVVAFILSDGDASDFVDVERKKKREKKKQEDAAQNVGFDLDEFFAAATLRGEESSENQS